MGEGETPSEGVSSGSGWLANRVTSVKEGRKRVSFGLCVFSGSFGVQSIVPSVQVRYLLDIYFSHIFHCVQTLLIALFFGGYERWGFSQYLEVVMCDVSTSFSSKILLLKIASTTVVRRNSAGM